MGVCVVYMGGCILFQVSNCIHSILVRNMNIDVILDVNLRFIFTHSCDNILVSQGIARI